uniref:Uncharacterized protein n=1 Tax=Tanacetum cinerariifolium TaxID=118510 RepID=A0A6L2NUK2_TANCI|nr:hypothetical protein [Tanacetum cinerariifolium]
MTTHSSSEVARFLRHMLDPYVFGAMVEELTKLHQTHAYDLIPLPAELSHRFYMKDVGFQCYFLDNKIVDIPLDANIKYTPTDGDDLHDPILYCIIVESLVDLIVMRPDMAY